MERTSTLWRSKNTKSTEIDTTFDDITEHDFADHILNLEYKNITYDFIMHCFGEFDGKCIAHMYDLLEVPKGRYEYHDGDKVIKNTNEFTTTVGIYLYNKILDHLGFEPMFGGYLSETINSGAYKKIEQKLSYGLIENDIDTDQLIEFENIMQWLMPFENVLSPNHTEKMLYVSKEIEKKKKILIKQHKAELDAGDVKVAEDIEKELLSYAKEYLGDDPCLDTIDSGAGGSFSNNFKNMYVMKGAVKNPDPNAKQKYNIVTSCYINGITPAEYSTVAGSGVEGAYARGNKTKDGGYWEKLFVSAFQDLKLAPKGSDCGTNNYIEVDFSREKVEDYIYSYVIQGSSLVRIDSKNINKFKGKTVKLRFSSMCKLIDGRLCNMCAGDLLYEVSEENVGMVMSTIPDRLKNLNLKAFHDATVKTVEFDAMRAFYPFD